MPRSRSWKTPLALLVLVAVAGHIYYWYWPRERPADPAKGGPAAALVLAGDGLPLCFWAPYPHQNLAGLAQNDSRLSALTDALQALRGDQRRALPTFGPFPLPPGHGLGICSDEDGDRLTVVAEVYPLLATVARWAGRLAGNPWLAGGVVETGGRELEVRWEGDVWLVGEPGTRGAQAPSSAELGPVLGLARLREPWGAVPSGLYKIERSGADLALRSAHVTTGEAGAIVAETSPVGNGISLVAVAADGGPEFDLRVMAMVEAPESAEQRLPAFVVLHQGPGDRWRLPREVLGPLLGIEPLESSAGDWRIAALDARHLARAEDLARELSPLETSVRKGLEAALWVDPRRVGPTLHRLADDLERLPIVKRRHVRAWRAAALAAGALEGSHLLTVAVVSDAGVPGLELRLQGRAGEGPAQD